jgi:dihydrofolate synthase/folylpolyglutamate synthase
VIDFRERIQYNNEMIAKDDLAEITAEVKAHWEAMNASGEAPSEFEVVVAIAFEYFYRQQCDIVILEVGMGGRLDSTNVIGTPLCSVITHISMDHMSYLGDTLAKIAFEKCGIIKPGGITVSYPRQDPEALAVIMERCGEEGNELHMGANAEILEADITGSTFRYGKGEYRVPLAGEHQVWNAITVIEAVKAVNLSGKIGVTSDLRVTGAQIKAGIAATRFPTRIEVISRDPLILLDGGHNPAEAAALAHTLGMLRGRNIHCVVGMMADKDVEGTISQVLPLCASVTAVTPDYPRAMAASELAGLARKYCAGVTVSENTEETIRSLCSRLSGDDVLLACGSLFLAGEIRPILLDIVEQNGI